MAFTLAWSAFETRADWLSMRLRLLLFFVRMWFAYAHFRRTLPVPVSVKRFLAPDLFFILGILCYFNLFCLLWFGG